MDKMKNKTLVFKLGTSSIIDEVTFEPRLCALKRIAGTVVQLCKIGHRCILVSSGAIGLGLRRMQLTSRPKHLAQIQALASIGQNLLVQLWQDVFNSVTTLDTETSGPILAQILLTRSDILDHARFVNAQNTLLELVKLGVIPIVNENDTLAVSEIKFGDNDSLSAITAGIIHADYLFILTDVDCLYDKNPRTYPDTAKPILYVKDVNSLNVDTSTPGSTLGTGGMTTKISAAKLAAMKGVSTIITSSENPENIPSILDFILQNPDSSLILPNSSIPRHTRFSGQSNPLSDRYFWILHGLPVHPDARLYIDPGALKALQLKCGLLPVGVVYAEGNFSAHDVVTLLLVKSNTRSCLTSVQSKPDTPITKNPPNDLDRTRLSLAHYQTSLENMDDLVTSVRKDSSTLYSTATLVGRALVNYSAPEIRRLCGIQSSKIQDHLGYAGSEYIASRQSIVLLRQFSLHSTSSSSNSS